MNENWNQKVEITSECPTCHQKWTRLVYDLMPWGACALAMCDACVKKNSDEHGNLLITMPNKTYERIHP